MNSKITKITLILISFIFLTGFLPFISLLGPGITAATSGSFYKAGSNYIINKTIKDSTGKNSLQLVKDEVSKKKVKTDLNQELKKLIEKRINIVRIKLNLENINP